MADKNTELNDVLEKGIDLKNRRIFFGEPEEDGSFSWQSVEFAIRAIKKMSADRPKTPIELYMSSVGGDTYEMLRLYDAIQECTCQIKFYGSGTIASSATWIMAGCDERWLTPNATIMIHAGYTDNGQQTYVDSQIDNEEYVRLMEKLMSLYEDNSRMPKDFWYEVCQRDNYLSPEEAIMLGLADKISEPKKRGNLRKSRLYSLKHPPAKKDLNKLVKNLYRRIHKGKNLTKIEVHIPKEQFDKNINIEQTEESQQLAQPDVVTKSSGGLSLKNLKHQQNNTES